MKDWFLFFIVSLLCFGHSFAQSSKDIEDQKKEGPQFKFDGGDTHDYHVITRGPILIDTFWFENIGTRPINITDVSPSCGCTSVNWSKVPVGPHKKGFISFGLKTEEQHGVFNKENGIGV